MTSGVGTRKRAGQPSVAATIRRRVERGGERFWRVGDFSDLAPRTVARTLARLVDDGVLKRARGGLYYRPRETVLGTSRASATAVVGNSLNAPLHPAGLTAANVLGFSPQNPAVREFSTLASNPPGVLPEARVRTRRAASRRRLNEREGALLEFLRDRGRHSDLSPRRTVRRLISLLRDGDTFRRLAMASFDEPPRVRAMLGALGEEVGADERLLRRLKASLNPLSTFDFGVLTDLPRAQDWQAR